MSRPTWEQVLASQAFAYGAITLYSCAYHRILLTLLVRYDLPHNPQQKNPLGLGYTEVARRYCRYLN